MLFFHQRGGAAASRCRLRDTQRLNAYAMLLALYGCEGLFYAVVVAMPAVLFQNIGASISWITFWTGILALPWSLKVFTATIVDRAVNLRRPLLLALSLCVVICLFLALSLFNKWNVGCLLALFGALGCVAAFLENYADRIYMSVWSKDEQARLMWFRNTAFRVTYLFGAGLLVSAIGSFNEQPTVTHPSFGWGLGLLATAVIAMFAVACVALSLPASVSHMHTEEESDAPKFIGAVIAFFRLEGLWKFLLYLSVFRLGDAVLGSVAQPFLLNSSALGGLGMKTSQVGFLYGTLGALSLIIGGIAGGAAIARFGVKKLLIPFSLLQSCSILCYCGLAAYKPGFLLVGLTNSFEQFTFGLTTACYSVVMLATVQPRFRATHFGLTCTFVNLGLLVPSMFSGLLVQKLGYQNFFLLSVLLSLLGPLVSCILPPSDYWKAESIKAPGAKSVLENSNHASLSAPSISNA